MGVTHHSSDNSHQNGRHNHGTMYLCLLDCAMERYSHRAAEKDGAHHCIFLKINKFSEKECVLVACSK